MVLGNCGLIETFPLKMRVVSDPYLSVRWLGETQIPNYKGGKLSFTHCAILAQIHTVLTNRPTEGLTELPRSLCANLRRFPRIQKFECCILLNLAKLE